MLFIDAISGPAGRSREAVATRDIAAAQLERARAHAAAGAALRRAGNPIEARELLRLAVDLAHRCGATELEDEALAELRAAGARPRRRLITGAGALTPSERRIAELAAAGRQNREIAEALVVTLATVEYHLRNAYRKLGIASRNKLGEALGSAGSPHGGGGAGTTASSGTSRGLRGDYRWGGPNGSMRGFENGPSTPLWPCAPAAARSSTSTV